MNWAGLNTRTFSHFFPPVTKTVSRGLIVCLCLHEWFIYFQGVWLSHWGRKQPDQRQIHKSLLKAFLSAGHQASHSHLKFGHIQNAEGVSCVSVQRIIKGRVSEALSKSTKYAKGGDDLFQVLQELLSTVFQIFTVFMNVRMQFP